jgi:hypothetical protein
VRAARSDALTPLESAALQAASAREAGTDREQLRRLGVVHTPSELVRFALGRVECALRDDFGLAQGLASSELELVDPAVGTGVWLSSLLSMLQERGSPARMLGLDADAAVLATARALLEPAAHALSAPLALQHANTLALPSVWSDAEHVRVIVGNPPWGARSYSRGVPLSDAWLREFHHDPAGVPLRERRSGVLSDDYVRFFRWALQQAREAPRGAVVCLVTNASFLDGPVHRGMRGALVGAFDRIELVDLGGNSLRSRAQHDDQALFPVRVGAALSLCVRTPRPRGRASLRLATLQGTRALKQQALRQAELSWSPAYEPLAPTFSFRAPPLGARDVVNAPGFTLDEAFVFHAEGVQTNRDELATARDEDELLSRLERIAHGELPLKSSRHFSPELAQRRLLAALEGPRSALIGRLAYRPFELRAYCRVAPLCHRPRPLLARAVEQSELCLLSTRKELGGAQWNMFALVDHCADSSFLSTRSACRTRVFPSHAADGSPNLDPVLCQRIAEHVGRMPSCAEIVSYVAGVLGSPAFRAEHQEALRQDYARLPWPRDAQSFAASVAAGQRFAQLLRGEPVSAPTLFVHGSTQLTTQLRRRALRWLSPHLLEVGEGTQIGASHGHSFRAHVGQHAIVESAYRACGHATIAALTEACARALMWGEAEAAADSAYRPASCVGRDAMRVAVDD